MIFKKQAQGIWQKFGTSPTTLFKWTKRLEAKTTRRKRTTKINMALLKVDVEKKHR